MRPLITAGPIDRPRRSPMKSESNAGVGFSCADRTDATASTQRHARRHLRIDISPYKAKAGRHHPAWTGNREPGGYFLGILKSASSIVELNSTLSIVICTTG